MRAGKRAVGLGISLVATLGKILVDRKVGNMAEMKAGQRVALLAH